MEKSIIYWGYIYRGQIYYGRKKPYIFGEHGHKEITYPMPIETHPLLLDLPGLEGEMECILSNHSFSEPLIRWEKIR